MQWQQQQTLCWCWCVDAAVRRCVWNHFFPSNLTRMITQRFALDTFQILLVIFIALLLANYLFLKWAMVHKRKSSMEDEEMEGFANPDGKGAGTGANIVVLGNEHLFDDFYAKIYDKLVDGTQRHDAEVNLTLAWAKSFRPETNTIQVLDVGCGTGHQVNLFKKAGCGKVVGLDASDSMIARGRKQFPDADFRVGNADVIGQFAAG